MIEFSRIRKVKFPTRGTKYSAGIDFYVPEFTGSFLRDFNDKNIVGIDLKRKLILLHPRDRVNIPSGIRCKINDNTALIAFNKSGISTKLGLDVLANVVDSDYQGEMHLSVVNTSNKIVEIHPNDKLVQFISLNVNIDEIIEIDNNLIHSQLTERSVNGFGSTDKNEIQ